MSVRLLRGLSVGYLLIPNLLFFYYWTRPVIAFVGISLLLYVFVVQWTDKKIFSGEKVLHMSDLVGVGILTFLLTVLSGTTGICWQTHDQWAHNVKFYDLFLHQWPIRYPATGPAYSYYFGYYLIPALYSKITGNISVVMIIFWTWLGLFWGICWVYLILNKKMIFVLLCFCIGDSPALLKIVAKYFDMQLYTFGDFEIEMWSLTNSILFLPNQVIPTLITVGMLIYLLKKKLTLEEVVFPITLSLWWAAFPTLTCGMLAAVLIAREWVLTLSKVEWPVIILRIAVPVLTCLPVLFLFASRQGIPTSGFVWIYGYSKINILAKYLVNIAYNLFIFLLVYRIVKRLGTSLPAFPFYLILVLMLIIPVYRIGVFNDFVHRGMMPYTLIAGLYLLEPFASKESYRVVSQVARKSLFNFLVLYMFFFSSYVSYVLLKNALKFNVLTTKLFPKRVTFQPYPFDSYPTFYEFLDGRSKLTEANQYLGRKGSIYETYIRGVEL